MQNAAQTAVINNRDARADSYGFDNSGLVAIDPNNGHILAMVGSVDYFNDDIDGQVNVTLQPLQPGSSLKPVIYAAGFEVGYTPNTILWDTKTEFGTATGPYSPNNYDSQEHGPLTVRSALQGSLNIPAVKMLYLVGVQKAADFAARLGYTTLTDPSNYGLSMVLGGAEVKLLEHVSAYGVFATEGIYHEPVSILKVEDANGEALEEWEESDGQSVLDTNITRMISNVLSDNVARTPFFGANNYLTLGSRPVAAKTGTTNDYKDAWTIGYTPQLVTGVWVGNTDGSAMSHGAGGSAIAAPIWNEFMKAALADKPIVMFNSPEIPITGIPVIDGQIPSQEVTIDTASVKLATDRTPERFRETKVCGEYHSILYYIDPSNPIAGEIDKPVDSAYERWESSVQTYITNYNASLESGEAPLEECEIPTEEDDLHTTDNEPDITIKSPDSGDTVSGSIEITTKSSANRGVARIEYLIDNMVVNITNNTTSATITIPSWVGNGTHTLRVVAYDDIDNWGDDQISINVEGGSASSGARISNPLNDQEIEATEATYTIGVELSGPEALSVSVYQQNLITGSLSLIGTVDSPGSISTFTWTLPTTGEYLLSGSVETTDGKQDIEPIRVRVIQPSSSSSSSSSPFEYLSSEEETEVVE